MCLFLTHWDLALPYSARILVIIGSGNSLLPNGTKPLPEPKLTYCKPDPQQLISVKFISKCKKIFYKENAFQKYCLQYVSYFVQASICSELHWCYQFWECWEWVGVVWCVVVQKGFIFSAYALKLHYLCISRLTCICDMNESGWSLSWNTSALIDNLWTSGNYSSDMPLNSLLFFK